MLACSFFVVLAVSQVSLKRLCSAYSLIVLSIVVIAVILSLTGLLWNKDVIPNSRLVYSYGFAHPNTFGPILFSAIAAVAYVFWDKRVWWIPAALAIICAAFAYFLLSSNASFAILLLLAIVIVVGHIAWLNHRLANASSLALFILLLAIPLVVLCIMVVCIAFYDASNPFFSWLNSALHARPAYAHQYFDMYGGFTWLGRKYMSVASYHNGLPFAAVDSGYGQLTLVAGLVPSIALAVVYVVAAWRLSHDCRRFLVFAIILIAAFYLMVESIMLYLPAGIALIFLSRAFAPDIAHSPRPE